MKPKMSPFGYRFCWVMMAALDWVPGYCRYYTVVKPATPTAGWVPRFADMQVHWAWQWHAQWGVRLISRLGLIGAFADESDRRYEERNRSSGS